MKVKVCGLKYQSNIEQLMQLEIDYMGFIFYEKSSRFVNTNLGFDYIRTIQNILKRLVYLLMKTVTLFVIKLHTMT